MFSDLYKSYNYILEHVDGLSVTRLCTLFESIMAALSIDLEQEFGCERDEKYDMVCNLFRDLVKGLPPYDHIEGGCI